MLKRTTTSQPSRAVNAGPSSANRRGYREPAVSPVIIVLSDAQVNYVFKAASGTKRMSRRVANLGSLLPTGSEHPQLKDRHLSRSLLLGLLVLAAFPGDGSSIGVNELSAHLQTAPSTTHRYVTTLATVGLIERDPHTRRYRLAGSPAI
jgi:hypothetical protein